MARIKKKKKEKKGSPSKPCKFCMDKIVIDYKDEMTLRRFITDRGKITPRRITGTCARHQRKLARSSKEVLATKALASKICKACYFIMKDQVDFDVKMIFG